MKEYMPYIVSIIIPIITGIITYIQANKKSKQEINKLREEHKTNLEELETKFKHEMEVKEKEQNYKIQLMEKEIELKTKARKDSIGDNALEGLLESIAPQLGEQVFNSDEFKKKISESITKSFNKNK